MKLRITTFCLLFIVNLVTALFIHASEERPNILWIVSEDNGPHLGAYGDSNALTPHLDKLAEEGIRYANCFANAPVCAVARSSWVFGVPAVTTGTLHMRSKYRVPRDIFVTYPEVLKKAGYYVTNNSKADYNTRSIDEHMIWHESSSKAHYKNRAEGQPFFAVFNLGQTHESTIFPKDEELKPRVAADAIQVPPYQIATPEVVSDWQRYYDRLESMDGNVGYLLRELKKMGVADDTIILYCSDHGGVTLRSKRFLHDSGTRVPLIVSFPPKWQHLAPEQPGSVSGRLVQFIDMPKTWLSLAGVKPISAMSGHIFLGEEIEPEPESVFLFSGRFDEAPDNSRAVTDGRWKYIRNYESDRLRFQMLKYPLRQGGQLSQRQAFEEGRTNAIQSAQYMPQPAEELYDTENDPHEIDNLAARSPQMLAKMRVLLDQHIINANDLGFIPEPMMEAIDENGGETIYEFGQSEENYPLSEVLSLATLASEKNPENLFHFTQALENTNPIIRYWGAVGLRVLGENAARAKGALENASSDASASVRIVAAVCLGNLGDKDAATELLREEAMQASGRMHGSWARRGLVYWEMSEALQSMTEGR